MIGGWKKMDYFQDCDREMLCWRMEKIKMALSLYFPQIANLHCTHYFSAWRGLKAIIKSAKRNLDKGID